MADHLVFGGTPGSLLLGDGTDYLLLGTQTVPVVVTGGGRPGYPQHRGVPVAPKNWPKPRKRERERVSVYDASPVVVQADSIDDIELVLLDLI